MERRYQLFADAGTKNIATYNGWVERVRARRGEEPERASVVARQATTTASPTPSRAEKGSDEGVAPLPEKLPWIVIVVDEFADLMMQQGKEVEAAVARLAQKARAAGMHVILATQRPSVDVITGIIKANFPTRIAYRVAQKVDSRTILDEQGAEHLLGHGRHAHQDERHQRHQARAVPVGQRGGGPARDRLPPHAGRARLRREHPASRATTTRRRADEDDAEQDPMYDDAVRIVADTRRCSTSWLQRKLGLGYNRAARIVEMMERRGLVGPGQRRQGPRGPDADARGRSATDQARAFRQIRRIDDRLGLYCPARVADGRQRGGRSAGEGVLERAADDAGEPLAGSDDQPASSVQPIGGVVVTDETRAHASHRRHHAPAPRAGDAGGHALAGMTLVGWLARRRADEAPHAIGIDEARESERRIRAAARSPRRSPVERRAHEQRVRRVPLLLVAVLVGDGGDAGRARVAPPARRADATSSSVTLTVASHRPRRGSGEREAPAAARHRRSARRAHAPRRPPAHAPRGRARAPRRCPRWRGRATSAVRSRRRSSRRPTARRSTWRRSAAR